MFASGYRVKMTYVQHFSDLRVEISSIIRQFNFPHETTYIFAYFKFVIRDYRFVFPYFLTYQNIKVLFNKHMTGIIQLYAQLLKRKYFS